MTRVTNKLIATCTAVTLTIAGGVTTANATHFSGGEILYRGGGAFGWLYPSPASIELISMSLTSVNPAGEIVPLPPPGGTFTVDSFFDITYQIQQGTQDSHVVDSFFDITYLVTNPAGSSTGYWQTEMVALSLSGSIPGGPSFVLRESPSLPSVGEISVVDLPGGDFRVDSFFDVWTEISVAGGPFVPVANGPKRIFMDAIVPEPATLALLGLGAFTFIRRRNA